MKDHNNLHTPNAKGKHFAIVCARYHSQYTDAMAESAKDLLESSQADVEVIRAPGVFEIPLTIQCLLEHRQCHGVVALGCVIRGETEHFNQIVASCTRSIETLTLKYNVPIGHGILAVDTEEQAKQRSTGEHNRALEAAMAVLQLSAVMDKIRNE